jgi:hypothetical protein
MRRAGGPLDDANREHWDYTPFTNIGPLRFGMTHDEVVAALGGASAITQLGGHRSEGRWAQFHEVAVTAYYGSSGSLSGVAIDALHGPQVTVGGIRLVGRVPSELAREFVAYAVSRGVRAVYSQQGDPGADELGLVLRAQRAGDILLTRPVFVTREWADRVSDASEGSVPQVEWLNR